MTSGSGWSCSQVVEPSRMPNRKTCGAAGVVWGDFAQVFKGKKSSTTVRSWILPFSNNMAGMTKRMKALKNSAANTKTAA